MPRHLSSAAALLLLLAGCAADDALTPYAGDTGEGWLCGSEPPTMKGASAMLASDEEGTAITLVTTVSDLDGGLHTLDFRVWHDAEVDGRVDDRGAPTWAPSYIEAADTGEEGSCERTSVPVVLRLPMDGRRGVDVQELLLDVADADGHRSTALVTPVCGESDADDGCGW